MAATYGTAKHAAKMHSRQARAMARFLHHYHRWNAHADSAALERTMGETSCTRLAPVVRAAIEFNGFNSFNFGGEGLSFVHDAFAELQECRSLLQHSYAFSFFRYKFQHGASYRLMKKRMNEKLAFEQLQSELEMLTEQMSDVVARLHLRATQAQIKFLTAITAEKRKDFSNIMIRIHVQEMREAQGIDDKQDSKKKKRKKSSRRRMRGILDDFTLSLATNQPTIEAATGAAAAGTDTSDGGGEADTPTFATAVNSALENEFEEAIRASLQDFMASVGNRPAGGAEGDGEGNDEEDTDWACSACTYMNSRGRVCEMCGTTRAS